MRTRRSWRNQERLWKALGGLDGKPRLRLPRCCCGGHDTGRDGLGRRIGDWLHMRSRCVSVEQLQIEEEARRVAGDLLQ